MHTDKSFIINTAIFHEQQEWSILWLYSTSVPHKHIWWVKYLCGSVYTDKVHNSWAWLDSSFSAFMNTSPRNTYISVLDTDSPLSCWNNAGWPITCGSLHLMNCVILVHRSADPNASCSQWFPVVGRTQWVMNEHLWSINPRAWSQVPPVFSKKCNSTSLISVFGQVPASRSALSLKTVESKWFKLLKDLSHNFFFFLVLHWKNGIGM